jgi:hypothetical protein
MANDDCTAGMAATVSGPVAPTVTMLCDRLVAARKYQRRGEGE